jgi:putative membrane protein
MHVSDTTADVAVWAVSAIHFLIAFAEIALWKRVYPRLPQFSFTPGEAAKAGPIVANAGLYNAFLAAGLLWSGVTSMDAQPLRLFFLMCVMVAGVFGAVTLKAPKTLVLQTLPALIAACLVWMAKP